MLRRKNTALNELIPACIRSCGCGTPRWTQAFCKWSSSVLFWKLRSKQGSSKLPGHCGEQICDKEISSMSRARTGHLLVLISRPWEQSQQTLGFSVQFWEGGTRAAFIPLIIFILIFSLSPSWSAVLGYLVSGFLSLIWITLSYKFNPNSWSVKNWLLGSVCIVALTETKSLLHWELTKWKRVSFPCMFSLKWLALFLERSGIFAGKCKG